MGNAFLFALLLLGQTATPGEEPVTPVVTPLAPVDSDSGSDGADGLVLPLEGPVEPDSAVTSLALQAAIGQLAQEKNREGKEALGHGKLPRALDAFRKAYELDPENPEIVNNLGYVYYLLGNLDEAERLIRVAIELNPDRQVAYLNLCDVLTRRVGEEPPPKEVGTLLVRARELLGNSPRVILRQARYYKARGMFTEARRTYQEYLALRAPTQALKLELGDFYRDNGEVEEARKWYQEIKSGKLLKTAQNRIWELEVEQQSAQLGWISLEVSPRARQMANRARELFWAKQYDESSRLFEQVLRLAPLYDEALANYADLLYRQGKVLRAELYYLRALAVKPDNPSVQVRLARLLMYGVTPRRSVQAAFYLKRALALRPGWTDLELELAHALRDTGNPQEALLHVKRFLGAGSDNPSKLAQATRLAHTLENLLSPDELSDPMLSGETGGKGDQSIHDPAIKRARAHLARGQLNAALVQLRSMDPAKRGPATLNLEARILLLAGRQKEGAAVLKHSLQLKPDQPFIYEQLGTVYMGMGATSLARIYFERARQLGDTAAIFLLARLDLSVPDGKMTILHDLVNWRDLQRGRKRLERFLEEEGSSLYRADGLALATAVKARIFALTVVLAGGVVLVLLLVLLVWVRLYGGSTLGGLIARYPDAGIGVQRILSAVRHEVLKHNTMMLSGVVEAMENGEDVIERLQHFGRQILGDGGNGQGGVAVRLTGYFQELCKIGNMHRMRLNLKRKDPVTAPLWKGMALIRRHQRLLSGQVRLGGVGKRALQRDLRAAAALLNIEGYEAVRALLDKLRVLDVDKTLLIQSVIRTQKEPSFAGVQFGKVDWSLADNTPSSVRIAVPRAAFEDIVTNLVRNAIQSTILYGGDGAVQLGLEMGIEVDEVTGYERLVILVKDQAPKELSAEMLRGRYIEEGLGLTADLVTRYDGTLDVIELSGSFTKAVAVKLPVSEQGTGDA